MIRDVDTNYLRPGSLPFTPIFVPVTPLLLCDFFDVGIIKSNEEGDGAVAFLQ